MPISEITMYGKGELNIQEQKNSVCLISSPGLTLYSAIDDVKVCNSKFFIYNQASFL